MSRECFQSFACEDTKGNLIGVDWDTNRPYKANSLHGISFWELKDKAEQYASHFPRLKVVSVKLVIE